MKALTNYKRKNYTMDLSLSLTHNIFFYQIIYNIYKIKSEIMLNI